MNGRIKKLRRALDLTQQEFADRIGSKRTTIAKYETDTNIPSSAVISLICREFNVSETWLRTGDGEMFIPSPDGALEALAREYELSPGMYVLIKRLLALRPENQRAVVDFAVKIAEDLNSMDTSAVVSKTETTTPAPDTTGQERTRGEKSVKDWTEADIEAEVSEYRRELFEEKRRAESESASTASSTSGSKLA